MPKIFERETFSVSLFPRTEKVWMKKGGVSRFSVEKFLSHSAENFRRGDSSSVSLIWVIGKVWIRGGGGSIKIFRRKFFVTQCRKVS